MKNTQAISVNQPKKVFEEILKGTLVALSVSLIGILIFAFIIRFIAISNGAIKPVNQVIKAISIFLGCNSGLKLTRAKGFYKGFLIGLAYTILSFLIFSMLDGSFHFSSTLINDLLFSGIIGSICGIIICNIKKR